jgi:hypothetical protein
VFTIALSPQPVRCDGNTFEIGLRRPLRTRLPRMAHISGTKPQRERRGAGIPALAALNLLEETGKPRFPETSLAGITRIGCKGSLSALSRKPFH